MGTQPEVIRREIEKTRQEMGETVEAIGYKADVPSRAKESVSDKVDALRSKVTGAQHRVSDATPDADQIGGQARQAVGVAQSNPLGLALGAVAAGFLAGMLVPETRKEHDLMGKQADALKSQVAETAQTAVEHGKEAVQEVAQETATAAKDAAQTAAEEHGEQVRDEARSAVGQAGEPSRPS